MEVKLDSKFATYESEDGSSAMQPAAYVAAWEKCDKNYEARVRRVGTLTVPGDSKDRESRDDSLDVKRARDIKWEQVLNLLNDLRSDGKIELQVDPIVEDLADYLEGRLHEPPVNDESLEEAEQLVPEIARSLASRLGARMEPQAQTLLPRSRSVQGPWVSLDFDDRLARFWVAFTPAGTTYSVPGWRDALQAQLIPTHRGWEKTEAAQQELRDAGFEYERSRGGKFWHRVWLPWDEMTQKPDPIEYASEWAYARIKATGWADRPKRPVERKPTPTRQKLPSARSKPRDGVRPWWRSRGSGP